MADGYEYTCAYTPFSGNRDSRSAGGIIFLTVEQKKFLGSLRRLTVDSKKVSDPFPADFLLPDNAHREKNKPMHTAFLDLEKSLDRVPHDVIWWAYETQRPRIYRMNLDDLSGSKKPCPV